MTFWYKAANTLIDDTKLRIISARLKISHCETVATFHSLLERCSRNNSDIFTNDFEALHEEINLQLGIENSHLILKEFQQKSIIEDNKLLKWNDYQANTSTQRVKEWRAMKRNETLRNVTETNVTQNRIDKKRIEENRIDKKEVSIPLRFDEFWQAYPKNGGSKAKSLISYKKAIKKGVEENGIIERAREYNGYCQNTDTKVAHATTWLNEERWTIDYRELYRSEKSKGVGQHNSGLANQVERTAALAQAFIND